MPNTHTPDQHIAVHFGAGNIGRGFIAPLLTRAGYHVTFADVQRDVVEALNEKKSYTVHVLDREERTEVVEGVSAVRADDEVESALLNAELVTTSVGVEALPKVAPAIAKAIKRRAADGSRGFNVIACENLVGNTLTLQSHVQEHLKGAAEPTQVFFQTHVGFSNCAVDRIIPPFEGDGPLEVGVEPYYEWDVDSNALVDPKPNVQGMRLTSNLEAYVERKLFTLNTGHAFLAFVGSLRGFATIDSAVSDPTLRETVLKAMRESGHALCKKHGFEAEEHEKYIQTILSRFSNPAIKDDLVRVARSPLRKLSPSDRLVAPITMCRDYDFPRDTLLLGVAAALLQNNPKDEECVEMRKIVGEKGFEVAITEITGFEKDSYEWSKIVQEYCELENSVSLKN